MPAYSTLLSRWPSNIRLPAYCEWRKPRKDINIEQNEWGISMDVKGDDTVTVSAPASNNNSTARFKDSAQFFHWWNLILASPTSVKPQYLSQWIIDRLFRGISNATMPLLILNYFRENMESTHCRLEYWLAQSLGTGKLSTIWLTHIK